MRGTFPTSPSPRGNSSRKTSLTQSIALLCNPSACRLPCNTAAWGTQVGMVYREHTHYTLHAVLWYSRASGHIAVYTEKNAHTTPCHHRPAGMGRKHYLYGPKVL